MQKQNLKLPALLTDGMVLQRNEEIKIWGWSQPQQQVKVIFKNREYFSRANHKGEWFVILPEVKAGGP